MIALIIATRNLHKVEEIKAFLGLDFEYLTLRDIPDAPAIVEDRPTFAGNAVKKSEVLAHWLRGQTAESACLPDLAPSFCLADDSGLEVDALHGAPGVHSARFAAESATAGNATDAANNEKLLKLLEKVPLEARTARFRCSLALSPVIETPLPMCASGASGPDANSQTQVFEGTCEGLIQFIPRGASGFGYDPLFIPTGYRESFAELGKEVKNRISHRAQALGKLEQWFRSKNSRT